MIVSYSTKVRKFELLLVILIKSELLLGILLKFDLLLVILLNFELLFIISGSSLCNVRSSPKKYLIGHCAFIWTQWTKLIQKLDQHPLKEPIHSVRSGETLYIYFNGQKSNLLS